MSLAFLTTSSEILLIGYLSAHQWWPRPPSSRRAWRLRGTCCWRHGGCGRVRAFPQILHVVHSRLRSSLLENSVKVRHLLHLMAVVDYAYAGCGQVQGDPVRQGLHKILDDLEVLEPPLSELSITNSSSSSLFAFTPTAWNTVLGHRNYSKNGNENIPGRGGGGRGWTETWIVAFPFCDLEHSWQLSPSSFYAWLFSKWYIGDLHIKSNTVEDNIITLASQFLRLKYKSL